MSRPRAPTLTASFWHNRKDDGDTTTQSQPSPSPMSLNELITTMSPPCVPSLAQARLLTSKLTDETNHDEIAFTAMQPIWTHYCRQDNPIEIQVAGFGMLRAYCVSRPASRWTETERLASFQFVNQVNSVWSRELWSVQYEALRAITDDGNEIEGVETAFLHLLTIWAESAFRGLTGNPDLAENQERAASVRTLCQYITSFASLPKVNARIPDESSGVLSFYVQLVDKSLTTPISRNVHSHHHLHHHLRLPNRRAQSSLATTQLTSLAPILSHAPDQRVNLCVPLFLDYLNAHMHTLAASHLHIVIPVLCKALAFCKTPLVELQLQTDTNRDDFATSLEDRVWNCLSALVSGSYVSTCMVILQSLLRPGLEAMGDGPKNETIGGQRLLRLLARRKLLARMARIALTDPTSTTTVLEEQLMDQALQSDDTRGWDLARLCFLTADVASVWIKWHLGSDDDESRSALDPLMEEVALMLQDILDAERNNVPVAVDVDVANAIGKALVHLSDYIMPIKVLDHPYILPIRTPSVANGSFLKIAATLFGGSYEMPLQPSLHSTLLRMAQNLSDAVVADTIRTMERRHDLDLTTARWLDDWQLILTNPILTSPNRRATQEAVFQTLVTVYDSMQDMPQYRLPLANLAFGLCEREAIESYEYGADLYRILGNEIFLRIVEVTAETEINQTEWADIEAKVKLLSHLMMDVEEEEENPQVVPTDNQASGNIEHASMLQPSLGLRTQSDGTVLQKDLGKPASLFNNIIGSVTGRSQSQPAAQDSHSSSAQKSPSIDEQQQPQRPTRHPAGGAVVSLVTLFSQLAFTPYTPSSRAATLAIQIFDLLIQALKSARSDKARLTALQFLMRLRTDRDHKLYFVHRQFDQEGNISALAQTINRPQVSEEETRDHLDGNDEERIGARGRSRPPPKKEERPGRGRPSAASVSTASRSRSRVGNGRQPPPPPPVAPREPLWDKPGEAHFTVFNHDTPSTLLQSYDPVNPGATGVVRTSTYLAAISELLTRESNWEIISFILCHLPTQLANKHLFCGPNSRAAVSVLCDLLIVGLSSGEFANQVDRWPQGLKERDAQCLAFHTLSVLISYQRCLDLKQKNSLVQTLQYGLDAQLPTVACCLRALTLAAFELQSSMSRLLSDILRKLAQIMSKPDMAAHIISFIAFIGSLPSLHTNLNQEDFKMVFGIALQYLQQHNQPDPSLIVSWALSQYLRVLSYSTVYVWFLAIRLEDRPQHVPFITRQLLLANKGRSEVDDPAEVCFDWLSRYSYASADPKPAQSPLHKILGRSQAEDDSLALKAWILGNTLVTVRALPKSGWVEWISRRPSGTTSVLAYVENMPLVGVGEVEPDMTTVPNLIMMDRQEEDEEVAKPDLAKGEQNGSEPVAQPEIPDSVTGYIWSGSAPSQRRKKVEIDPGFLPLQMSSYPRFTGAAQNRVRVDPQNIASTIRVLDKYPVIDTHRVGVMYAAPGQTDETKILSNNHGSPAYTRFLEGLGRLIDLRGQQDVYEGGLRPEVDGNYAYAWWDDIGQIVFHTATMMPTVDNDPQCTFKKRHLGNDHIQIVWNDSGHPYKFDTLKTQFTFVNIVIEPHSWGTVAASSDNVHENEYFKVTVQRPEGVLDFTPVGDFKLISAEKLPLLVRQLCLLSNWFATVWRDTENDTEKRQYRTNWIVRLQTIQQLRTRVLKDRDADAGLEGDTARDEKMTKEQRYRDFTLTF